MTKTVLPDYQAVSEAIEFIETHGRAFAKTAVGPISLIEVKDKTLIIGAGTNLETHITKNPDGTVVLDSNGHHLPLQHNGPRGYSRFDALWTAMQTYLERAIYIQLQTYLEIPPHTDPDAPPDPKVQLLQSLQIDMVIQTAASQVREDSQPSRITHPHRLGTQTLHKFLGPRRVQNALSISGPNATLAEFSIIQKHRKPFNTAYKQDPNATTLWFSTNRYYLWKKYTEREAESIIEEAKDLFLTRCRTSSTQDSPLRLKPSNHPAKRQAEQQMWKTFSSLDHKAVRDRRYPADHNQDLQNYVNLCNLIITSGETIPPWVQKFLLDQPYYLQNTTNQNLINSFISAAAKTTRHKAQEHLQAQLHTIHQEATKYWTNREKHSHLAGLSEALDPKNPVPEWQSLLTFIHSSTPATPPTRPPNPCTKQQIYDLLTSQRGDEIKLLAQDLITIHTIPGRSVAVYQDHKQTPTVRFVRNPDGTISAQRQAGSQWWPNLHKESLPDPQKPRLPEYVTVYHIFNSALALMAHRYARANWSALGPWPRTRPPTTDQLAQHLNPALLTVPCCAKRIPTPTVLDQQIASDLATLTDPAPWNTANCINGKVAPHHYNLALTLGESLTELHRSNPGATTWAMAHEDTADGRINHPGQLIASARASLANAGLNPRNWKFAATLNTPVMTAITKHTGPKDAALILNAAAHAQSVPHPLVADKLADIMGPTFRTAGVPFPHSPKDQPLYKPNISKVISLACRESARTNHQQQDDDQPDITNVIPSLHDYANHMTTEGLEIKSTTWNGLLKASERWHRQQANQRAHISWQQHLQTTDGKYLAWHSALDVLDIEDYTVTPLTDEKQLHYEAADMNHCVHGYGPHCARGHSRIFSVSKNGKQTATTEIRKREDSWSHAQTRLKDNHQAPQDLIDLMAATLPERYRTAETESPQPSTTSWKIQEGTTTSPQSQQPARPQDHPEADA